ncbi:MAG: hypothetical protein M0Z41_15390 [Peptococcaceae bacterium]|jgi:hypothetical protein|nr:hypothetical protein [Peptococcaceae bacterium]
MCCSPNHAQHGAGQCHGHHGAARAQHACGCHDGHFSRRVYSKEEELTKIESYLQDLQAEVKAVEERIGALKN